MDAPTPHAVYQNSGFPAGCVVGAIGLAALVCLGVALVHGFRGNGDAALQAAIGFALATGWGVFYYRGLPIELSLAPSFVGIRFPFGVTRWIPVSSIEGRLRHGQLGRIFDFRVTAGAALSVGRQLIRIDMAFFSEKSTGGELTDEILLAAIPDLKVDNSSLNRFH
ncbi:MAG TPA: hypothetical protein VEK57_31195 [Thermoanaerobaculia bacterium]|nr:hypothetical protein [Thermoanaerobaculia bacterium]